MAWGNEKCALLASKTLFTITLCDEESSSSDGNMACEEMLTIRSGTVMISIWSELFVLPFSETDYT